MSVLLFLAKHWKAIVGLILLAAIWGHGYYTANLSNAADRANERARAEQVIAEFARAERDAVQKAREAEQRRAADLAKAADAADAREDKINEDYERRIAGLDADRDRLRDHWQGCKATSGVSVGAAVARAADEADRLRREGAAGIVRAVERVQSERDEAIDRYEAVRSAANSGK